MEVSLPSSATANGQRPTANGQRPTANGQRPTLRARAFTLVRLPIAAFLLFTADAKIHGLSRPVFDASFLFSPQLQVAAIEAEILVALLLLWAPYSRAAWLPRAAWLAAIGLFALFGGVSFYLALVGQRSCGGCLGVIRVNPWGTFALDAAIVAALCICRPPRGGEVLDGNALRRILITAAGAVAIFGVLCGAFWLFAGNTAHALARLRGESISIEPAISDVGDGRVGENRSFRIHLTNHSDKAIRVIGGHKRCGCVPTDDLPITLPAGESRSISVRMSFGGSPGRFQHPFMLYAEGEMQRVVTARFRGRVIEQ